MAATPLADKVTISTESTGLIPIQSENAEIPYFANLNLTSFYKKFENEEILSGTGSAIKDEFQPEKMIVRLYGQEKKHPVSCSFVTEKWEGVVKEVYEDGFLAHLYKKGNEQDIIEGDFDFDDIPKDDRHLISPGVFFYWILGREVTKGGQISNVSCVKIRRIPSWKKFDINASSPKSDEFTAFFADDDTSTDTP
jgi:hypothetical protein